MKKNFVILLLLLLVSCVHATQAQEPVFADTFDSYTLGDLNGQDNWAVTKYYTDTLGTVQMSSADSDGGEKYAEITNNDSILVSRIIAPLHSGMLQFKMRHNKSGLFYLQAQTSDAGGQLLFSIQFTPLKGILLEEAGRQSTLLPDYNPNVWYFFTIDFDNQRGENGTFKIQINGETYGEHEYVNSESDLFDLAQITFGSESEGTTAISAFNTSAVEPTATTTAITATTTVSTSLRQLSIALATSTITTNLEDGYIVTATFDTPVLTTSGLDTPTSTTEDSATSTGNSLGGFIAEIIETVINIFTPEKTEESTEPAADETPEIPQRELPATDNIQTENALQSTMSNDEVINNDITTTTF